MQKQAMKRVLDLIKIGEYRRGSRQIAMTPSSLRAAYFVSGSSLGLQNRCISQDKARPIGTNNPRLA